jgi:hypothetical protein
MLFFVGHFLSCCKHAKKKLARALLKSNYLAAIGMLIVRYLVCPFSAIALSLLDADSLSWCEESRTIV